MYRFIDKHCWKIIAVLTICITLVGVISLIVPEFKSIDDQITALYDKAAAVETDFSLLWQMENVSLSVYESEVVITYEEQNCKLIVTYDKNKELLTKELVDSRIGSRPFLLVLVILFVCAMSLIISTIIVLVVGSIFEISYRKE